jgi:hypothetical protein
VSPLPPFQPASEEARWGMTSLQLLILFLAVMLVVALGAAGTFI